jgi:hypothetical protein
MSADARRQRHEVTLVKQYGSIAFHAEECGNFAAVHESAFGPSRRFTAKLPSVAFGEKRTSNGRQDRLAQSQMTQSGLRGMARKKIRLVRGGPDPPARVAECEQVTTPSRATARKGLTTESRSLPSQKPVGRQTGGALAAPRRNCSARNGTLTSARPVHRVSVQSHPSSGPAHR